MAYALVGAVGALGGTGVSSTFTPAWGTGETRAAGNLLILWGTSMSVVPTGWTAAVLGAGIRVHYMIAAGADAAPSVTATYAQLAEFSGNSATPLDQIGTNTLTSTSPGVVGPSVVDAAAGELVTYGALITYTTAATKTTANTLNNGATAHDTSNDATSIVTHISFGWGITTTNAANDQDSLAYTVTKFSSGGQAFASFLAAAGAPTATIPDVVMAPPIAA